MESGTMLCSPCAMSRTALSNPLPSHLLHTRTAMSGIVLRHTQRTTYMYAATRGGTNVGYAPTRCYQARGNHSRNRDPNATVYGGISLRACYTISDTGLACGTAGLRACCAMSGTEIAYDGSSLGRRWRGRQVTTAMCLPPCYAMSGTDMAYHMHSAMCCIEAVHAMCCIDIAHLGCFAVLT
eukprot:2339477-Rhodomonas_salina.1